MALRDALGRVLELYSDVLAVAVYSSDGELVAEAGRAPAPTWLAATVAKYASDVAGGAGAGEVRVVSVELGELVLYAYLEGGSIIVVAMPGGFGEEGLLARYLADEAAREVGRLVSSSPPSPPLGPSTQHHP